jgi:hypothetical protein
MLEKWLGNSFKFESVEFSASAETREEAERLVNEWKDQHINRLKAELEARKEDPLFETKPVKKIFTKKPTGVSYE